MTLSEFVESKTYKTIMKYVYGWGASVVLAGALFKIQHYPGAGAMLVAGMSTEVLIFFLSAFEPLHEEPDWTLVYPELAGMTNDLDDDLPRQDYGIQRDSRLFNVSEAPPPAPTQAAPTQQAPAPQRSGEAQPQGVAPAGGGYPPAGGQKTYALERFDELLEKAELGPDLFVKMGEGIQRLSNTAEDLNKMQDVVAANENYAANMHNASESARQLSETFNSSSDVVQSSTSSMSEASLKAAEKMEQTGDDLSSAARESAETIKHSFTEASKNSAAKIEQSFDGFSDAAKSSSENLAQNAEKAGQHLLDAANETGSVLSQSYQQLISEMESSMQNLKSGNQSYIEQIDVQNKHLTALNSIYELQMQNLNQQNEQSQELYNKANQAIENMSAAVGDTQKYKEELNKLNDNLAALNNVYGNMLSSFNLNVNE
ncbi:gliding motility-associated protein GldL [Salinivirga cyanobacteriivorans]|uniref:Gliding motility-associated protein GldL n=1 Tax=Salinivirga cyanobacteriivorans TaxID=1307839 RepID=A0A0S2I1A3_9BACT|nr:gliding motility protein GldL [Salinivirga cyanobacteriivorans]ALO16077.1 gliding motility-associated protein GldL [Salinivirga cyanobacteriivorans]